MYAQSILSSGGAIRDRRLHDCDGRNRVSDSAAEREARRIARRTRKNNCPCGSSPVDRAALGDALERRLEELSRRLLVRERRGLSIFNEGERFSFGPCPEETFGGLAEIASCIVPAFHSRKLRDSASQIDSDRAIDLTRPIEGTSAPVAPLRRTEASLALLAEFPDGDGGGSTFCQPHGQPSGGPCQPGDSGGPLEDGTEDDYGGEGVDGEDWEDDFDDE